MPNIKSAKKRLRQSENRRVHNRHVKSEIRTLTRKFLALDSADEAQPKYQALQSLLDRAARKRILHPNTAGRHKARLARHLERLQGE